MRTIQIFQNPKSWLSDPAQSPAFWKPSPFLEEISKSSLRLFLLQSLDASDDAMEKENFWVKAFPSDSLVVT